MKKFICLAGCVAILSIACAEQPAVKPATDAAAPSADLWMTDHKAALDKAKAENKHLLMDFTGSDWCGWCIKLEKDVFSQTEFKEFAAEKLVLLKLDFPHRKALSPELKAQNDALAKQYNIEGFPTILILDSNGKTLEETGFRPGGAAAYVEHLKGILEKGKAGE